eukprot:GFKZ01014174.1.p1 GENE.GFKZ01014174.1~~GFKZ01014174.1.p1  ORF type:complete len:125 (+),score=5.80 GFKZ01014174.1:366-740(+)
MYETLNMTTGCSGGSSLAVTVRAPHARTPLWLPQRQPYSMQEGTRGVSEFIAEEGLSYTLFTVKINVCRGEGRGRRASRKGKIHSQHIEGLELEVSDTNDASHRPNPGAMLRLFKKRSPGEPSL